MSNLKIPLPIFSRLVESHSDNPVSTHGSWSQQLMPVSGRPKLLVWCSVAFVPGTTKGTWQSVLQSMRCFPFLMTYDG